MNTRLKVAIALCILTLTLDQSFGKDAPKSLVTVQDLARFAAIGNPQVLSWKGLYERDATPGLYSPDRSRVAVVVSRGNPERETNDAALLVYRVADLLETARPYSVAEFSSATNYQPIALARWLDDSETLVLAGTQGDGLSQIYSVNVRTRAIRQLTRTSAQLIWYDVTQSGTRLITLEERLRPPLAEEPGCRRRGCRISAASFSDPEQETTSKSTLLSVHDLKTGAMRTLEDVAAADSTIDFCDPRVAGGISPDGRFAIRMCRLRGADLPAWWGDYTVKPNLRSCAQVKNARCFRRGLLTDLDNGKSAGWSDAPMVPIFSSVDPLWIDGGRQVILTGALESLTDVDGEERARRSSSFAILLMDPVTRTTERIARLDPQVARVTAASWQAETETLTLETQDAQLRPLPALRLKREGRHWIRSRSAVASEPRDSHEVRLVVEQSLNGPPVLIASDTRNGIKRRVLDPNPWLAARNIGYVKEITWRAKDGRPWRGGLYHPPDYKAGSRYPLVIQTHGFESNAFSLHGIARNFAGQALAAHGIAVLQVAENGGPIGRLATWSAVQGGYEGAIDHLDELGIVDRDRVGIQGWSITGTTTGYTLTHSSYRFAAGAFTNTSTIGWLWYMAAGAPPAIDSYYGAAPFGDGLDVWLRHSPAFNLDRVTTPMLMWGEGSGLGLWDWYAGLRRLGKPVEYWVAPDSTHDVFQVGQRIQSNQLLVDWFRFWLKDEEDSEPEKTGQYLRWRELRRLPVVVPTRSDSYPILR